MPNVNTVQIEFSGDAAKANAASQDVSAGIDNVGKSAKQVGEDGAKGFDLLEAVAGLAAEAIGAMIAALSVEKLKKFVEDVTLLTSRVELLGIAVHTIGSNMGFTHEQIDTFVEDVEHVGVGGEAARQALAKMAGAQLDLTKASALAEVALNGSKVAQISSSEAFERLVQGIAGGQVRILKTMGIFVDFTAAQEKYATVLHKNKSELTEQEIVNSRLNAVLEYGNNLQGVHNAALGTAAGQMQLMTLQSERLKEAVGGIFTPELNAGVKEYNGVLVGLIGFVKENQDVFATWVAPLKNLFDLKGLKEFLTEGEEYAGPTVDPSEQGRLAAMKATNEMEKTLQAQREAARRQAEETERLSRDSSRAALDAGLAIRLATLKESLAKETETYKTQEKDLDLVLAQRGTSEQKYYQDKTALEKSAIAAAITSLEQQKAAILAESTAKSGLYKEDKERIKEAGDAKAKAAEIDSQIETKRQEAKRLGIDLSIKETAIAQQNSLAEMAIAVKNYQKQMAWLQKLDDYKQKTGQISDETALGNRYERERQLLSLQQEQVGEQILQEKSDAKRNELIAEYHRLQAQVLQSKQAETNETALILAQEEQLSFAHGQKMQEIEATAYEARLHFAGQEQAALIAHYAWKREQLDSNYLNEMQRLDLSQAEKLAKEREYQQQSLQLEREKTQKQAELWWTSAQKYMQFGQQMTSFGVQLLLSDESQRTQIGKRMLATSIRFLTQELQQYMFHQAEKHLLAAASAATQTTVQATQHISALAMGETEALFWATFYGAQTLNPLGGQAFIPAFTAMTAVAAASGPTAMAATAAEGSAGVMGELGMAAAWGLGGMLVGGIGEGAAAAIEGGASGTQGNPVATTSAAASTALATATPAQPAGPHVVNIYFHDAVVMGGNTDQLARDMAPAIQKAINDGVH